MGTSDKRQMAYEHYLNSIISQMKALIAHGIQMCAVDACSINTIQVDFDDIMVQRGSLRAYALHLIEGLLGCGMEVVLLTKQESRCREMTRKFVHQVVYSTEILSV